MTAASRAELARIARESFDWDELRRGQLEAMEAAAAGRDVLAVMPTGYGKSAVYQVAAVALSGPTVVVSPLIALQADQVAGLDAAPDAPTAVVLNSTLGEKEQGRTWRAVSSQGAEFLFLSPEQLAKDEVLERIRALAPSLVVVDEAHCVSSWGHDFRPDYLRLGGVVEALGRPTVIALTATAAPPVRAEIIERLGMRDPLVVARGFDRPNLHLDVVPHPGRDEKRRAVLEQVGELPLPGLVYTSTRKDTEDYAQALRERGLRADAYHAGRRAGERADVHRAFLAGELDVVVATAAFGMGIDKPDVRFVLHADAPGSLDSYYQEVGRAGRDGEPARAVLHYRPEDLGLRRFFSATRVDEGDLRAVLGAVRRARGPLTLTALRERLDLPARRVTNAVNVLEEVGAVAGDRAGLRAEGRERPGQVVARVQAVVSARERVERSRVEMMRGYAETTSCRRQFLLGYFGEESADRCGACDVCDVLAAQEAGAGATHSLPLAPHRDEDAPGGGTGADGDEFALQAPVVHTEWGPGVVMRHEGDRITVFFEQEGYKTLARDVVTAGALLRPAGA
ncbi:RecQ family ATP-dependent DNA helicase [Georgenia wangjunii]|uniref:RecQ family ATP-dependent DNA helicase n=1 Tax=Georgenia wangjunii TaxID=3117730 RepID=UPI002F263FD4